MENLFEMTRYDVLRGASPEPWSIQMQDRISGYILKLNDVELDKEKNRCIVEFVTSKAGHTTQYVYINLEDFWEILEDNESSEKKISLSSLLNLVIMHGDIKVYCTCPHWVYGGYKYIATELNYILGPGETRFPRIRNPRLMGTLCKHAYLVVSKLPYQKFPIEQLMRRKYSFLKDIK